ncbi:MAG TPA: bifunctional 4-hydroxy-2-oxoglutarate aldolase/2-dehydro-3-deoxy-phosphogluconate aldolase [Cytophagales bacterium]|nr:bifunctional 4-hydroxy-2-oxoglutarate aldolase/2-dehydro-3-deoxy-phosphogluconate aldolase [Cytophagales bacterium]
MFSWQRYHKTPIVGILRGFSEDAVMKLMPLYKKAGLTTIEITMNTSGATKIIRAAVDAFGHDINIGAGTVITLEDYSKAVDSGASFIVTPVLNEMVVKKAVSENIPIFPGAFTPTEVYHAWSLGVSMVKVFPTTFFGADYIKELKAPLNNIKLLATGGVTMENMVEFFSKGSDGVGMASQLFPKDLIQNERWDELLDVFKLVEGTYRSFKK